MDVHVPPGFETPPTSLVAAGRQQLGHFHGPPGRVNLLDARYVAAHRPFGARPGAPFNLQAGFKYQFR